jgi:hypothetical protein
MCNYTYFKCNYLKKKKKKKNRKDRKFVSTVSRIMSGHCTARSHLIRFRIVEEAVCIFLKDYETVDHLIWHYEKFKTERRRLTDALTALDVQLVCSEEVAGDEILS